MSWQSIDFQGIVSLDTLLTDLLDKYLTEKEDELACSIIDNIPPSMRDSTSSQSISQQQRPLKISKAIEVFSKTSYLNIEDSKASVKLSDWKKSVTQINKDIWHYIEILEGTITELFQQLEQLTLEQWHNRLAYVIGALNELLLYKMENLIWAIRRLDRLLLKSRAACASSSLARFYWQKAAPFFTRTLDKSLIKHLEKTQESLKQQYQKFLKRYDNYIHLVDQADKSFEKFSGYQVFSALESEVQKNFLKLYHLLKLWELNRTEKVLPTREFVIALRNEASVDKAINLFKLYYNALHKNLFKKSLLIKEISQEILSDPLTSQAIQEQIHGCQLEVHMLGSTISTYREFLLKANPDPYVRTKLGFSEWNAGPEPAQIKPLLNLGYDVEAINDLFDQMLISLKKAQGQRKEIAQVNPEIQSELHEMSQPLATYRMMRNHAEKILEHIQQLDELGSLDSKVIPYIGDIFRKSLRVDWRYNVLQGFPLFHQLYVIHQGFLKPIDDWQHVARFHKFQKLLNQIQEWVKTQKTQTHFHEIELDMNDIKGYLQDFLGYVQRISADANMTAEQAEAIHAEIAQQLLEYRYLFGNFFYQLRQNETEGQLIRKQFLFVDQYFESVEFRLYELKKIQG